MDLVGVQERGSDGNASAQVGATSRLHSSALDPSTDRVMERKTGFEPATNSLEGCDSTPELLPRLDRSALRAGRPGCRPDRAVA